MFIRKRWRHQRHVQLSKHIKYIQTCQRHQTNTWHKNVQDIKTPTGSTSNLGHKMHHNDGKDTKQTHGVKHVKYLEDVNFEEEAKDFKYRDETNPRFAQAKKQARHKATGHALKQQWVYWECESVRVWLSARAQWGMALAERLHILSSSESRQRTVTM